jgi:hypothetical protein
MGVDLNKPELKKVLMKYGVKRRSNQKMDA